MLTNSRKKKFYDDVDAALATTRRTIKTFNTLQEIVLEQLVAPLFFRQHADPDLIDGNARFRELVLCAHRPVVQHLAGGQLFELLFGVVIHVALELLEKEFFMPLLKPKGPVERRSRRLARRFGLAAQLRMHRGVVGRIMRGPVGGHLSCWWLSLWGVAPFVVDC